MKKRKAKEIFINNIKISNFLMSKQKIQNLKKRKWITIKMMMNPIQKILIMKTKISSSMMINICRNEGKICNLIISTKIQTTHIPNHQNKNN